MSEGETDVWKAVKEALVNHGIPERRAEIVAKFRNSYVTPTTTSRATRSLGMRCFGRTCFESSRAGGTKRRCSVSSKRNRS